MAYSDECRSCWGKGKRWNDEACRNCNGTGKVKPYRAHVTTGDWHDFGCHDRIHGWPEYPGVIPKHCRVCLKPCTGRRTVWCDDRVCKIAYHNRMYRDTHWIKRSLIVERGPACQACGEVFESPIREGGPIYPLPGKLTVDHVVRLIDGGTDHPDNLQLLCYPCHKLKTAAEARGTRFCKAGMVSACDLESSEEVENESR